MGIETYNADRRAMLLQWYIVLSSLSVLTQRKQQRVKHTSAKSDWTELAIRHVCFCDSFHFNLFLLNSLFGFGIILIFCICFNWTTCKKKDVIKCTVRRSWGWSYCIQVNLLHLIFQLETHWPFSCYLNSIILHKWRYRRNGKKDFCFQTFFEESYFLYDVPL